MTINRKDWFNPVKTIGTWFNIQSRYWTTVAELQNLNDRELEDIGVRRCDINIVAMKSVRRELGSIPFNF